MARTLIQSVVDSLRVSGPAEAPLSSLRKFPERAWQRCLPWLHESGLALYFLDRLRIADSVEVLPSRIRTQLEEDLLANRRRLEVMRNELGTLLGAFDEARVNYLVLKGLALVPEFCPDAGLRSQYDYDFLVHPESAPAARRALEACGYTQKVKSPGYAKEEESLFTAQPLTIPSSDQGFYSLAIPRDVELHLALWETNQDMIAVETPQDVLGRKRLVNWQGLNFPAMADDDALIAQALHAFQHVVNFWCKPSWFFEISRFLANRRSDEAFNDRLRLRVNGHRHLAQILGLVFSLSETLFAAPLAPELARWTTWTLPRSLSCWVEEHGQKWALARFPGDKRSLVVHREFVDDPAVRKQVERRHLFPFHRPAKVVEPSDRRFSSSWKARWQQGRFVLSRLRFHLHGLVRYKWEIFRRRSRLAAGRGCWGPKTSKVSKVSVGP
jgi:hypothetical protein